ncbi:carboxymethylenebutenolidase [Sarracenia purpurea var. burkii]
MAGAQCCKNPPSLNSSSGVGRLEEVGSLKSYVSGDSDSRLAVVLISDIFGYEAPKLRKLADKVASAGFYVVVPDFLYGDPYAPENAERPLPVWIKDHEPDKGVEDAKSVIEALKSKGVSGIGAAGFCWGAKVVVELAKHPYISAGVLLHPFRVSLDDIEAVKVPISILGAEFDEFAPPELLKQFEEALNAKPEVDSLVKIFPGVEHGWTVRYNDEDEVAVARATEAQKDLLDWLYLYVK